MEETIISAEKSCYLVSSYVPVGSYKENFEYGEIETIHLAQQQLSTLPMSFKNQSQAKSSNNQPQSAKIQNI